VVLYRNEGFDGSQSDRQTAFCYLHQLPEGNCWLYNSRWKVLVCLFYYSLYEIQVPPISMETSPPFWYTVQLCFGTRYSYVLLMIPIINRMYCSRNKIK